jgi:hypothetical protein
LRFWDVIATTREENMRKREAAEGRRAVGAAPPDAVRAEGGDEIDDDDSPLYGPTIGRRRDFVARGVSGPKEDKTGGGGGG